MKEKSTAVLRNFLDGIEKKGWSDEVIAKEYLKLWWNSKAATRSNGYVSHVSTGFQNIFDLEKLNNISFITSADSFDFFTKRALLISDFICLYEPKKNISGFCFDSFEDIPPNSSAQKSISYSAFAKSDKTPSEIGRWIRENTPLISSELAAYIPEIEVQYLEERYWNDVDDRYTEIHSPIKIGEHVNNKSLLFSTLGRAPEYNPNIRAISEVEIPYIDGMNIKELLRLIEDSRHSFINFRNELTGQLLDLDRTNGSENFDSQIKKIGLEIKKGLEGINSDIRRFNRNSLISSASAVATTITATLVAISGVVFNEPLLNVILEYFAIGGGFFSAGNIAKAYLNHKQDLNDKPYYFVWLLHR